MPKRRKAPYKKVTKPACWDWPIPLSILDMAARANTFVKVMEVLRIWQPGCAICGQPFLDCLDHDHETGLVRGFLCNSCNTAEGQSDHPVIKLYRHINPAFILDLKANYLPPGSRRRSA